ncbi:MAG: hypothetical protein HY328_19910 [Chloroflexi bacterium]|nr:hypothetical protein [Chloroflexota bacterium]
MTKRIQTIPFVRPLEWVMLLVAAFALILALEPSRGMAAPGKQTSPLATATSAVSPLGSPLSTPTPTATSPMPPTSEPPANIQNWPTATPTAYPLAVQAAFDSLTGDDTLGIAVLEFSARLLVDDPVTGDELTAVRLTDPSTATTYWLRATGDGDAALLPDFSDEALALLAQTEKVDVADLQFAYAFYIPFPFTRQILWLGQVSNTKNGTQYSIALDLAGEEVNQAVAAEAEAAVVLDYCGAIDVSLCVEILYAAEGDASNALLVVKEEGDPEPIIAFLDDLQVLYEQDEESFYFRLENDTLRELAQLEEIETLQKNYPDEVRPLDSNLVIGLIEQSGALSLTLESQKAYPLLTYRVEATLERVEITQTQSITLLAQIDGIFAPASGQSSLSPATGALALGKLNGRYNLALTYTDPVRGADLLDTYLLIVSDGRAVIRPSATAFTWPKYTTWLRLPGNAIWFVVQARSVDGDGTAIAGDPDDFATKAAAFYDDIAGLRARDLSLAEGVYTNALFVPPWPTWQIPDGELVRIPVSDNHSYLFKWPAIRYFTYTGPLDAVAEVITEHCVDEVAIVGYTANGDLLDVCQP